MNSYNLSRNFWNYSFENPHLVKPNHIAVYFFALELCNKLGWKKNFGLPTTMAMEAIGIKSYSVYKKTFDELVQMGFFEVLQLSKNQYTANIIALKDSSKAHDNALDKATVKHTSKQVSSTEESTLQPTVSIDKQINNKQTKGSVELSADSSELINVLVSDFGFGATTYKQQQSLIMAFVINLEFRGITDHFKTQYRNYNKFKSQSGQKKHHLGTFIGTAKEQFSDGLWNSENWSLKLSEQASTANHLLYSTPAN